MGDISNIDILVTEVNELLGISLTPPIGNLNSVTDKISRQAFELVSDSSYPFDKDATCQLVAELASDKERPWLSFINDIAEILFLQRKERSEYKLRKSKHKPYLISKIMLEYALKSRQLDKIIGVLTKGFCANKCTILPLGCCYILGYDMGMVPKTMLKLQIIEAKRTGWKEPEREDKCKFHSPTGCVISLFKSPACIGYLCDDLNDYLHEKYQDAHLKVFLRNLSKFRNSYIDRHKIFEIMGATILSGSALIQ
jgi:hypothetical protein